jgi:hypothetical protein
MRREKMSFNVGDSVVIVYAGAVFSTYASLAEELRAANWINGRGGFSGHLKNGMSGVITKISGNRIYLVRVEDGYDYLIEQIGLAYSDAVSSKYSRVINKINEMERRRKELGYAF